MAITEDKSAEQIAKDKEAVRAMQGAKDNMVAALNRIAALERTLIAVQSQCGYVAKSFGDGAHFNVWHNNTYAVRSAKAIFDDINNTIKAAL